LVTDEYEVVESHTVLDRSPVSNVIITSLKEQSHSHVYRYFTLITQLQM